MTPSPIITELRKFLKKNFQTTPLKAAPFFFGALTVAFAFFGLLSNHSLVQSSYGAFGFLGGNGSIAEISNSAWLTLAAIFAPLTVASVISYLFWQRLHTWWFFKSLGEGKIKDHIIVCGLGVNNRHYILSELDKKENRESIVVIENDPSNPHIETFRKLGVFFLLEDASDVETLKRASILTCKHILVSTGLDSVNFSIASALDGLECTKSVYLHVTRKEIEMYANEKKLFKHLKCELFSFYENAARDLLVNKRYLTSGVDTIDSDEVPHMLIIGFGDLGQEVALQAIKQASFYNDKELKLTIIDADDSSYEQFLGKFPIVSSVCEFEFCHADIQSQKAQNIIKQLCHTYIVIALKDDDANLGLVLKLHHLYAQELFVKSLDKKNDMSKSKMPTIAVRFTGDNKLDLTKKLGEHIISFGQSSQMSTHKILIDQDLDKYAKQLHEAYVKKGLLKKLKSLKFTSEYRKLTLENFQYQLSEFCKKSEWEELDNFTKDSNRSAIDHYRVVKDEVLKRKVPNICALENGTLDVVIKDRLVDVEHKRWDTFHRLYGWKHQETEVWGKCKHLKETHQAHRLHPCLVETDDLIELGALHKTDYWQNDLNGYIVPFGIASKETK